MSLHSFPPQRPRALNHAEHTYHPCLRELRDSLPERLPDDDGLDAAAGIINGLLITAVGIAAGYAIFKAFAFVEKVVRW